MHWKKLVNPDYLGAYSLEQNGTYQNLIVTIESVSVQQVPDAKGDKSDCVVAILKGEKPLILNKTNLKAIEKVMRTPDVNQWQNKKIELTVQRVRAFGETVDALRVVPKAPAPPQLPVLQIGTPQFENVKAALKQGYTMAQVQKKYQISKAVQDELTKTV
jgi:hypothetical protein